MAKHDQNPKMRMKGERLELGENCKDQPGGKRRKMEITLLNDQKMLGHFSATWIIAKINCAKFHPNGKN